MVHSCLTKTYITIFNIPLQQLTGNRLCGRRPRESIDLRVAFAESIKKAFYEKQLPQLGRNRARLERAFVITAKQNHIGKFGGPRFGFQTHGSGCRGDPGCRPHGVARHRPEGRGAGGAIFAGREAASGRRKKCALPGFCLPHDVRRRAAGCRGVSRRAGALRGEAGFGVGLEERRGDSRPLRSAPLVRRCR